MKFILVLNNTGELRKTQHVNRLKLETSIFDYSETWSEGDGTETDRVQGSQTLQPIP